MKKYISLSRLARNANLPKTYLKQLADKGQIPALNISGRLRFNPAAVQQALDNLASKGDSNEQQ